MNRNFIKQALVIIAGLILGFLAVSTFAAESKPRSPEEQAVLDAEAKASAARKVLEEKKAIEVATRKAEWNSKTFGEAMAIRGQACVDGCQWVGGQALRGAANGDALVGKAVVVPTAAITGGAMSLAEAGKAYADNAFVNPEPKQVATRPDAPSGN